MLNTRSLHNRFQSVSAATGVAAFLAVMASFAQIADAQSAPFTWDKIDAQFEQRTSLSTRKAAKEQVIYGRQGLAANRAAMEDWYRKYLFPAIASEGRLGEIQDHRMGLEKDLTMARSAAVHQFILDIAYDEATKRVLGNYHPAVKYNALLIVGNLNQSEVRQVGPVRYPPVRLAKAFDFMADQLKKPGQVDAVRVAAMLGINRHLYLVRERSQDQPIPEAKKAEVAALMQTLVNEKTAPKGRAVEGHTWMRRVAIDCLATIGKVGDGLAVFNSLVKIVDDKDEPLSLRCTAARSIERLYYTDVTGIDALATSRSLATLAAYASRNEDARVKEELKEAEARGTSGAAGSGYPGMGGSGYPGMGGGDYDEGEGDDGDYPGMGSGGSYPGMGGPTPSQADAGPDDDMNRIRKRLKLPLHCVLLGLRGREVKPTYGAAAKAEPPLRGIGQLAADDTQKGEIKKIIAAVEMIVEASDAVDNGIEEMMKEVRVKTRELEVLVPSAAPAEEEAAADDALPGGDLPGGDAAAAKKKADKG